MQWELRAIHYTFKRFKHTCYKLTQNFGKMISLLEWSSRAAGLTLHNVAYWHETCHVRWSVINKKVLRAANGVGQSWTVNKGQSRWNISSSPSSSERYILIYQLHLEVMYVRVPVTRSQNKFLPKQVKPIRLLIDCGVYSQIEGAW